jgi:hypothetical protein
MLEKMPRKHPRAKSPKNLAITKRTCGQAAGSPRATYPPSAIIDAYHFGEHGLSKGASQRVKMQAYSHRLLDRCARHLQWRTLATPRARARTQHHTLSTRPVTASQHVRIDIDRQRCMCLAHVRAFELPSPASRPARTTASFDNVTQSVPMKTTGVAWPQVCNALDKNAPKSEPFCDTRSGAPVR